MSCLLQVKNLSFAYNGAPSSSPDNSLCNISFSLQPGEAVALVGAADSGKTTLLQALAGFIPELIKGKMAGNICLDGQDPGRCPPSRRLQLAGILLASPEAQLSGICTSVEEEIAWGLGNLGLPREVMRQRVEDMLQLFGITEWRLRHPLHLSQGQKQRLALAALTALSPRLFLLDEPAAYLDASGLESTLALTRRLTTQGHAVIWSTPNLKEAALFERWLVLEEGRLTYDGPPCVSVAPQALEAPWTTLARQAAPLLNGRTGQDKQPLPATFSQALEQWRHLLALPKG